jgi:urease accessory protein
MVSFKSSIAPPVFTQRLSPPPDIAPHLTLALTADERTKSRLHAVTEEGQAVYLQLPRGMTLKDGDWLQSDAGDVAQIHAKPEPVMTVTTQFPLALLQAAYHLGNRHVPLEITSCFLRLSPDPVLHDMLLRRGLQIHEEVAPFQPELGAYGETQSTHHH